MKRRSGPRKNISKACTFCKTRKRKCDGQLPCSFCVLKNKEAQCNYDFVDRRSIRYADQGLIQLEISEHSVTTPQPSTQQYHHHGYHDYHHHHHHHHHQQQQQHQPQQLPPQPQQQKQAPPPQIQQEQQQLPSPSSKFIGESSPLTLLNQTRRIFQNVDLTPLYFPKNSDSHVHHHDNIPTHQQQQQQQQQLSASLVADSQHLDLSRSRFASQEPSISTVNAVPSVDARLVGTQRLEFSSAFQLPPKATAQHLFDVFSETMNQLLYLYSDEPLKEIINTVYSGSKDTPILCQFYTILAISCVYSRPAPPDAKESAGEYFQLALALLHQTVEEANLWGIKVYILMFIYYLLDSKPNTGWLNFCHAVRIAESLGFNRKKANQMHKDKSHSLQRRMLWRTLYILDRAVSINLGRPLVINDKFCDDMNSLPIFEEKNDNNIKSVVQNELVKLSKLKGEVYEGIYFSDSISSALAYRLALELNHWATNLPHQLKADVLVALRNPDHVVTDKYLYHSLLLLHLLQLDSLLLLTRPFFHFHFTKLLKLILENIHNPNSTSPTNDSSNLSLLIRTFTALCRDSSICTIRFCWYFVKRKVYPMFSFVIVNAVLNSALIMGLVCLLDILKIYEAHVKMDADVLDECTLSYALNFKVLNVAIFILQEYAVLEAFGQKYYQTLSDMHCALNNLLSTMLACLNLQHPLLTAIMTNPLTPASAILTPAEQHQVDSINMELRHLKIPQDVLMSDSTVTLAYETQSNAENIMNLGLPEPTHGVFQQQFQQQFHQQFQQQQQQQLQQQQYHEYTHQNVPNSQGTNDTTKVPSSSIPSGNAPCMPGPMCPSNSGGVSFPPQGTIQYGPVPPQSTADAHIALNTTHMSQGAPTLQTQRPYGATPLAYSQLNERSKTAEDLEMLNAFLLDLNESEEGVVFL